MVDCSDDINYSVALKTPFNKVACHKVLFECSNFYQSIFLIRCNILPKSNRMCDQCGILRLSMLAVSSNFIRIKLGVSCCQTKLSNCLLIYKHKLVNVAHYWPYSKVLTVFYP